MIALAQASIVLLVSFFRLRHALFLLVLFLAFSPRSLGLILGQGSVSLTFIRMAFPILIIVYLFLLLPYRNRQTTERRNLLSEPTFGFILVLGAYKILASLINDVTPVYAIESLLMTAGPFMLFYISGNTLLFRTICKALTLSLALTVVVVLVELQLQQPLHFIFANPILYEQDQLVFRGVTDRGYRVQGVFDNALSLAEYLLYTLPFLLYRWSITSGRSRIALSLGLLCLFGIGALTGSRGFLVFATLTLYSFWLAVNWSRFRASSRGLIMIMLMILSVITVVILAQFIVGFLAKMEGFAFYEIGSSIDRSTFSRALQIREVISSVSENPFFGFGVLQNFSNQLDAIHRIDNYYLRTALESGFIGLILFLGLLVAAWRSVMRYSAGKDLETRAFFALGVALMVAFLTAKTFLSMPTNNFIFYALLGMYIGLGQILAPSASRPRRSRRKTTNLPVHTGLH